MKRVQYSHLIEKARTGDEAACIKLIVHKRSEILTIATKIMGNRHDGEDVAQEVSILIRRNIESLKSVDAFDAWVYRITYRVCLELKKKPSFSNIDEEQDGGYLVEKRSEMLPFYSAINQENHAILDEYLDQLNEKQKQCLRLFYYEGYSYVEIMDLLGISKKELSNTLERARKKLRGIIDRGLVCPAA